MAISASLPSMRGPIGKTGGELRAVSSRQSRDAAPVLLEFQSPTAAVIAQPLPLSGRLTIWTIAALVVSGLGIMSVCSVDRVVAVPGRVVAQAPNIVVQPLDTSIVRSIDVHEGQMVHKGDLLARLDPTFASADARSIEAQVDSLQAEVGRLEAEANGRNYVPDGSPMSELQARIFAQRHAEQTAKVESYRQRIDSARSKVAQTSSDIAAYAEQYKAALAKEAMRRDLERLRVGSRLSLLDAETVRAENGRNLQAANTTNLAAKSDLEALVAERDAFLQQTRSETSQQLVAQRGKLSEALDERNKRDLRRRLVDLRAERDGVVLTVAKVSVGSVMQSGEALMTLVPNEVVLEVEASIAGRDAGFVQSGNAAVIKFDTFSYTTYGYAVGTVRTVSGDSFVDPQSVGGPAARPGAVQPEGGRGASFYRARVSLDDVRLHNLPGSLHLTQGMPVTVDIKVGEHTIIAYFAARVIPVLSEGLREP